MIPYSLSSIALHHNNNHNLPRRRLRPIRLGLKYGVLYPLFFLYSYEAMNQFNHQPKQRGENNLAYAVRGLTQAASTMTTKRYWEQKREEAKSILLYLRNKLSN